LGSETAEKELPEKKKEQSILASSIQSSTRKSSVFKKKGPAGSIAWAGKKIVELAGEKKKKKKKKKKTFFMGRDYILCGTRKGGKFKFRSSLSGQET